jgi:hypothetical protein
MAILGADLQCTKGWWWWWWLGRFSVFVTVISPSSSRVSGRCITLPSRHPLMLPWQVAARPMRRQRLWSIFVCTKLSIPLIVACAFFAGMYVA